MVGGEGEIRERPRESRRTHVWGKEEREREGSACHSFTFVFLQPSLLLTSSTFRIVVFGILRYIATYTTNVEQLNQAQAISRSRMVVGCMSSHAFSDDLA